MVDMGDVVRCLRIKKGWDRQKLSKVSGISRHTIERLEETGRGNITSLERVLGVMGYELEVVSQYGGIND